jgi:LruC domain-containing protein
MKNNNIIILLLLVATGFFSCLEPDKAADENLVIESIDDLRVPADFHWKTTQTLRISVVLPNDGDIKPLTISNSSGTKRYFRGYPDDGSRTVNTIITIPSYLKELSLTYNGTDISNVDFVNSGSLSYNFNTKNKSANKTNASQMKLGLLANFTLYSGSGAVSSVGISDVSGDVGTNLGAVTGFGPPSILNGNIEKANSITTQASLDLKDLILQIGKTVTTNSAHAPAFGNETLTPGVYAIAGASSVAGTLTLDAEGDADALFVFKIGGAFTTGAGATVVLVNGASPKNIFWIATGAVAMAASTTMSGNVIANPGAVSMGANGKLNGRLLSAVRAVSLLNCTVLIPDQTNIILSSLCENANVIFTIKNTGIDMAKASVYTLFKNDKKVISDAYQLHNDESIDITVEATIEDDFKLTVKTLGQIDIEETFQGCGPYPTEHYSGSLAYEDLWPGKGDFDFNDLVVDYDFNIVKNNKEIVQRMTATFVIQAYGASSHNGFGFTLPSLKPEDVLSVNGHDVINHSVFSMASNGLENGQSKATIIVFDNTYRVMPTATGGTGANTQLAYGYTEPVTIVIDIVLANKNITFSDLNIGNFNPFMIVGTSVKGAPGSRGKEIHLPNQKPSDLFDTRYFKQSSDNSSPSEGRYFITADNLPWAINVAEQFHWMVEYQDVTGAYNMFSEWAQSSGILYRDWYHDNEGYRNKAVIYR